MHMDRDAMIHAAQRVVPAETTRYGLVIGINQYADVRLNLRCAVADACALRDLMVDPECGCFPAEHVQLLVDQEATTERIFRALAHLRRMATENDTVWIYYAGHAAVEGGAYWVTHDADVDDLFATALSSERINSVLAQLRTRRVLYVLDCCYAEAAALMKNPTRDAPVSTELLGRFEGHGIITLAASSGKERSVELSDVGHGAFTYFLAKGLRGEADANKDGVVTADELWSYLRGKVAAASGRAGKAQTPMLIGSMTHDMALTLNPAETAKKRRLISDIEGLVGLRADQLSTDDGRLCTDIVLHGARTDMERLLLESLEELSDEKLTDVQFRRLLRAARARTTLSFATGAQSAPPARRSRLGLIVAAAGLVAVGATAATLATFDDGRAVDAVPASAANAPPPEAGIVHGPTPTPAPAVVSPVPPAPDPRVRVAPLIKDALMRFVAWSRSHPHAACPDAAALGVPDDPWGHPLALTCTEQPADQIAGAVSAGPDGRPGTADDIASWQLDHEVSDLVRGARWVVAPATPAAAPPRRAERRPEPATPSKRAEPPAQPARTVELDDNGMPIKR
jgi:Caspase domain